MTTKTATRTDIYTRVTDQIVEQLERGVRPWLKPWNAEHAAGRITRPLRHSGEPYHGINILMLWAAAETQGFNCPIWLTYKQAQELGGNVRKGEHGSPVVYASTFKKTDTSDDGQEIERDVAFLKQYTVFNACQCEGLPERFYQLAEPPKETLSASSRPTDSSPTRMPTSATAETRRITQSLATISASRLSRHSATRNRTPPPSPMS